jgi:hypothetical protein
MRMSDSDGEPSASLTPGQLLDARLLLDDQTFDALDDQHQRLAARVEALESAVAVLEGLLLRSPGPAEVPGVPGRAPEPARPPRTQLGKGGGTGAG